jgi:hypothetical protein
MQMEAEQILNENLHLKFIYCDLHDQGAVAVITDADWQDIITNDNDNEKIFKYVKDMCGSEMQKCEWSWRFCGCLEYNSKDESLSGTNNVQTNFYMEAGGWKFTYFKNEIFTSKDNIDLYKLPLPVIEFLTHLDTLHRKD